MKKKKIVIFGATGNVGSYVLRYAKSYFAEKDFEVIASGRRKTDFFWLNHFFCGMNDAQRVNGDSCR